MKTRFTAALAGFVLAQASLAHSQGINGPLAQPSPSPVVNTPRGPEVGVGGTRSYEQLSGAGGGGIMIPSSNGTSTVTSPSGSTQTVPTPR